MVGGLARWNLSFDMDSKKSLQLAIEQAVSVAMSAQVLD